MPGRMMSQSSSSSSDSSLLDPAYAVVDVESRQDLISLATKAGYREGENSSTRRCSLAVVSLVVSVVCLVLLAASVLLFWLYVDSSFSGGFSEKERVCTPCSQIKPSPMAETEDLTLQQLDVRLDDDGETEICCASTPAQYATFFKLILQRQQEVTNLVDIIGDGETANSPRNSTGAVSAHLLCKTSVPGFEDKARRHLQQWKSPAECPSSHVRGGLKFHNHNLYVQRAGYYFVYCQIMYNRAPSRHVDGAGGERVLASHYIKRHSVAYPATSGFLLKARHTRVTGQDDRHSSYTGGVFYLHAGDQLYVKVSVPKLVSNDDRSSFFGLFRVGD